MHTAEPDRFLQITVRMSIVFDQLLKYEMRVRGLQPEDGETLSRIYRELDDIEAELDRIKRDRDE
jgi:hypothetical protein